jgi:hypothetical protein
MRDKRRAVNSLATDKQRPAERLSAESRHLRCEQNRLLRQSLLNRPARVINGAIHWGHFHGATAGSAGAEPADREWKPGGMTRP